MIEYDPLEQRGTLPPLRPRPQPLIPVEAVLAVGTVVLSAGDVPPGLLQHFYTQLLGLELELADEVRLAFRHGRQRVELVRGERPRADFPLPERYAQDPEWRAHAEKLFQELYPADPAAELLNGPVRWRGVLQLAVVEMDAAIDVLRAQGVPVEIVRLADGGTRIALLADPAGNLVQLHQQRRLW